MDQFVKSMNLDEYAESKEVKEEEGEDEDMEG